MIVLAAQLANDVYQSNIQNEFISFLSLRYWDNGRSEMFYRNIISSMIYATMNRSREAENCMQEAAESSVNHSTYYDYNEATWEMLERLTGANQ